MTRVPEASVLTAFRRSGSTSSPARSTNSAGGAASTKSSPSALNSPSFVRQRFCWSLRIALSLSLSGDRIMERKRAPQRAPGRVSVPWCARLRSHGLPGPVGKAPEGLRVADGDVGQHLAVDLDAGLLQAVHELAVRHALLARGRVDADDPQPPEVTLAVAAVAVGVRVGLEQGLLGPLVALRGLAAVALGPLERGAALLARVDRSLDATHLCNSSVTRLRSAFATSAGRPRRRMRFELFLPVKWLVKECAARSLPLAVLRNRFFEPE